MTQLKWSCSRKREDPDNVRAKIGNLFTKYYLITNISLVIGIQHRNIYIYEMLVLSFQSMYTFERSWIYGAFGKYSDPLTFHMLLCYSIILKLIKLFFPLINLQSTQSTQYPIMTKQKQVFRHFCKCIKNKKRKWRLFHARNWQETEDLVQHCVLLPSQNSTNWPYRE